MIEYFKNLGLALDELLNVLLLDGYSDETISYHAAVAQREGKRWGCILCWILARLIQPQHCPDQLKPYSEPTSAALRAGAAILALAILVWFLIHEIIRHLALIARHL